MSDQEQLTQELSILAQEDPAGFQRIINGLEEQRKPFMLENLELVQAQLTFLVQRDRTGFDRAVQALEDLQIDGGDGVRCFLGFYTRTEKQTTWIQKIEAYDAIKQACAAYKPEFRRLTAVEIAVLDCRPGRPLTNDEQAFLTLCKLVRECSLQATGSEE